MARTKVTLNHAGMRALLFSRGVTADLVARAERVAGTARARAPRVTGAYVDSIGVEVDDAPSRARVRVLADVAHATSVEARHRTLGSALDAAR